MAFNIDPKDLNLQDAAGMQLVEIIRNLAKESGATGGLSDEAKQALMDCFENVAWVNDDGQDYYNALYEALFGTTPVTPTLVSISAVFTQGSAVIYDTDSLNTLKQYLVVTATYSDSSTATVNNYTLSGTLTAGTSTITASYGGQTDTFTVNVTASVTLVSISAVFTQGAAVIYDTDSLDTLKQYLVVTATYSDSSTETVNDYTLSGTLTSGTSTITASYGGETDTFNVTVVAWTYEWDYTEGLPSVGGWVENITGTGAASLVSDGVKMTAAGASDNIRYNNPTNFNATVCTLEAKVKVTVPSSDSISGYSRIHCGNGTNGIGIVLRPSTNKIYLYNATSLDSPNIEVLGTFTTDEFHTVRLVLNGSSGKVYFDGVLLKDNIDPSTISYSSNTSVWHMGSTNTTIYTTWQSSKIYIPA